MGGGRQITVTGKITGKAYKKDERVLMFDLVVFGDPVLDYVYKLSDPTQKGGKMLGKHMGTLPGGTTSNVVCAASRLGIKGSIIGRVAKGQEQQIHAKSFDADNVETSGLYEVDVEKGVHTVIYLDPDGEKTLIYVPMEQEKINDSIITQALNNTRFSYVMAADFDWLAEPSLENAKTDSPACICVDVDAGAGLSSDDFEKVRHHTDILFINDVGFLKLTGQQPSEDCVAKFLSEKGQILCCTGGGGTTYMAVRTSDGVKTYSRSALDVNVIDTTGAGDCFNAAFMSELLQGQSAENALDFAMMAGGLATEVMGARDSAPTREAVLQRLKKQG